MKPTPFIILGMIIMLVGGILFMRGNVTGNAVSEEIVLGYCPTMQNIAEDIASSDHNIRLIGKASSADALSALSKGDIDVALIGRIAKESEGGSVNQRVLRKGYTLITAQKSFVQKEELQGITISTYLPEDVTRELLPGADLIFYTDKAEAMSKIENPVLISWSDYDNQELLVVMYGNEKDPLFRVPVLYSDKDINSLKLGNVEANEQ